MTTTFASLGVPADIERALAQRGITDAFPIQAATIPDGLAGRDLTGKAPTGSGKTIAFGVPMVARVKRSSPKRPKGLVLAPTRELALQVADELRAMSGGLRVLAVYGGAGIEPQIKQLRQGVDIVVACPGRLLDLIDRKACDLRDVSFAVLDEADRMADMGFLPDVRRILDQTNDVRQTVLFSATLDGAIDTLVRDYQHDPVVHEMADEQTGDIHHHFWQVDRPERVALLARIVDRVGPTVVFCRTKHGSDRVAQQLGRAGIKAAAIHGNRSQAQRERALRAFHDGEVAALVATDVAARGIHVEGVQCVVHYDIPADHKDYIHRSGRTGRAGGDGTVVALFDKGQRKDVVKLKRAAGEGDVEIAEADVDALPEGPQQAFRPVKATRDRDRSARSPQSNQQRSRRQDERPARAERPVRAERAARPEAKEQARASRTSPPRRRDDQRTSRSGARPGDLARTLPAGTAGADKVRPSGASRRKAKREQLLAAGEPVARTKKRRSGKPRPPAGRASNAR